MFLYTLIRVEKSLFYVFPLLEYILMFIRGQNALTIIFAKMQGIICKTELDVPYF